MSTIEGGMICTDDDTLANTIRSIRSHGWDRDLPDNVKSSLREENQIDDFRSLYTFYWQGYNLRSTDLQAKIGLSQLDKLNSTIEQRKHNFRLYQKLVTNSFWKPSVGNDISNMAYPIITPHKDKLISKLQENKIECRPLVCGSIGRQPFWIREYGELRLKNADIVHDFGLYVPNHHALSEQDIKKIADIVNEIV